MNNVGISLRGGQFESDIGIVKLHKSRGTFWICYINENYFVSSGCVPPQKLSKFIIKRYGPCLYSEYKIKGLTNKQDSYCASCCLYITYLTDVISIDFESAVLNLYYQMIQ